MWETLTKVALTVGAVWTIAALSAKVARQDAELDRKNQESKENEKVDDVIRRANSLGRDECLNRLRGGSGK